MFINPKSKVDCVTEVGLLQLVLFDLETSFNDLKRFSTANSNMRSNLLVTTDAETSHGVSGLRGHGFLLRDLVQNTNSLSKLITTATGGNVQDKFVHFDLSHCIFLGHLRYG